MNLHKITSNVESRPDQLHIVQGEDEDVILEGTDLHEALLNMGYTDFNSVPRVEVKNTLLQEDLLIKNYKSTKETLNEKLFLIYQYLTQENSLRKEQLKIIAEANILLDDHLEMINDLFVLQKTSVYTKILEWFPLIGSTVSASLCTFMVNKQCMATTLAVFAVFGYSVYEKFNYCITIRNLKYLVMMQNDLHKLIKQCLKILRFTYGRKAVITNFDEKHELLGHEKLNIIFSIKQLIVEVLENLSIIYYQEANNILNIMSYFVLTKYILTKLEIENKQINNDKPYNEIRSLYYSFILVQSEMMFILANAYNNRVEHKFFQISKSKLSQIVKNLGKTVTIYYFKLSKIMHSYQLSKIKPVRCIFRGVPNSKWQDAYVHLDLTSQRIQLAFKEIISVIESIDTHSEENEDSELLFKSITEKMNEAYKQIENAKSFAEFTSLLIAKIEPKSVSRLQEKSEDENLFPINIGNKNVVVIDKDPIIEDEVFEEYIKEEYLKPLYENSDESVTQNFKLDKLLAKIFMSELKEVLIEKQKSMTERELKALKRMYQKVQKNSFHNKSEPDIAEETTNGNNAISSILIPLPSTNPLPTLPLLSSSVPLIQQPPPPPSIPQLPLPSPPIPKPPPLPETLVNTVIQENISNEESVDLIKTCIQKPFPRVKMLQPENIIPDAERFSLTECTPNFRFPPFKFEEETFLGSGENSEEEIEKYSEEDESVIDLKTNIIQHNTTNISILNKEL